MMAAWVDLILGLMMIPTLYLFLLTVAALGREVPPPPKASRQRRIAIVVPAHNEARLIAVTVTDLLQQRYPRSAFTVWVIADNCTDTTAAEARKAGAKVWERTGNPGKGQALHDWFQRLLKEDWEAFLVVDADSHLHPDALAVCNDHLEAGAKALQLRYGILNPHASLRTRALELSMASFNALRPLGKVALGLSAGLFGNGFCLARETLERVPYLAHSIVEDIEYHLLLLRAGIKVDFRDDVGVKAQMPVARRAAATQRVRWERGRWLMIRRYLRPLVRDWLQGHRRALDGLVDVLMPPVSLLGLGFGIAVVFGSSGQRMLSLFGLGILMVHYGIAAWRYGHPAALPRLMCYLPYYLLEKTWTVAHSFMTQRQLPWVRTERF